MLHNSIYMRLYERAVKVCSTKRAIIRLTTPKSLLASKCGAPETIVILAPPSAMEKDYVTSGSEGKGNEEPREPTHLR